MDLLLSNPYEYLDGLLMVFVRMTSLFIAVPLFSNKNIPAIAKIGLAFLISTIIINVIDIKMPVSSANLIPFAMVLLKEVIVGWLIGLGAYLAFAILVLVGQFIDYQIGFSMVNVFDPLSQVSLTITGNLYYYLVLLITVSTNAHHYFIKAIIKSFELIPIGEIVLSPDLYNNFIAFFNEFFITALKIAAPFFFVLLLTNVVLGILARTAPQLNLFVIGFPLKIILGLLVLFITLTVFSAVSDSIIDKTIKFMDQIIKGMMP